MNDSRSRTPAPRPTPGVRGVLVSTATVLGVGAVLALNPSGQSTILAEAQDTTSPQSSADASSATPQSTPSPATTSSSDSESDPDPTASASTSSTVETFDGSVYHSPYGDMQVTITVEDGTLTDVAWAQIPSNGQSSTIAAFATPTLVQEALSAQSADIDSVSGASYTSKGFTESLQSALEDAGL